MEELKETVDMMLSENYKERFQAEYYQLRIRLEKLKSMVEKWDKGELNFTPTCPRDTYDRQIFHMENYLRILENRSIMEGIVIY